MANGMWRILFHFVRAARVCDLTGSTIFRHTLGGEKFYKINGLGQALLLLYVHICTARHTLLGFEYISGTNALPHHQDGLKDKQRYV
jgi:hypothetical protein